MTLVEWTRTEPGQVEAVVAMLVNREKPTSVRITPSRGDGGVDILDRGGADDGGDVVYQVKSYTNGFDARQKASVRDSFDAVQADPRWEGLRVTSWRLVTPWNPSPEAEVWLQDFGSHGVPQIVWHGLDFVEQLAAKYPDVIDYYLRGGADRIRAAQAQVLQLMGLERAEGSSVSHDELTTRIQSALGVLDHDPHYRFEYRFGQGVPPGPPTDRPGLALHTLQVSERDGRWIAIDVIARCNASAAERPITVNGSFPVGDGSTAAQDWDDFMTFGTPFSTDGASGELDAPGGVGGSFADARMFTGPADDSPVGDDNELLFEVLTPADEVAAAVEVDRVEVSRGALGGLRSILREVNGVFELENRFDLGKGSEKHELRVNSIDGLPVRVASRNIQFLSEMREPNRVRISQRHGSAARGVVTDRFAFERSEEATAGLEATRRILEVLQTLQLHTGTVIRTPDFKTVPSEQFREWRIAASLLSGNDITANHSGDHMVIDLPTEVEVGDTLTVSLPHVVRVSDQEVDLGRRILVLNHPQLIERVRLDEDSVRHVVSTPGNKVTFRWHDPSVDG